MKTTSQKPANAIMFQNINHSQSSYLEGHNCTLPKALLVEAEIYPLPEEPSHWMKFKAWAQRFVLVSSRNPTTRVYFRSNCEFRYEQLRHVKSKNFRIIHPFSMFRIYWEMFLLITSAGIVFIYPVDIAFKKFHWENPSATVYLTFFDVTIMLDILITFRTGYYVEETREVILDPHKIAKKYAKTTLIFYVLSAIPVKLIADKVGLFLVQMPRFKKLMLGVFKIYHVKTLLTYIRSFCFIFDISSETYHLMKHVIIMLVEIHWSCCAFTAVPAVARDIRGNYDPKSWVAKALIGSDALNYTFSEQYITSLYQATCVLMSNSHGLAFPDIIEDYILYSIIYVFGHITMGFIFILFLNKALALTQKTLANMEITSEVHEYMRYKQFSLPIQNRLKMFYRHHTYRSHFKQDIINNTLTERLKTEIQVHCNSKLMEKISLFLNLPEHIMHQAAQFLEEHVYLPNDLLVRANSEANQMYFIVSGSVALFSQDGLEICHLSDGSYIGETDLILKNQSFMVNAVILEVSEVLRMERKHFYHCFTSDREVFRIIVKACLGRVSSEEEILKKKIRSLLQNLEQMSKSDVAGEAHETASLRSTAM